MDLIKSPNDKKEYRVITLQNGLTAMLISDIHEKKQPGEAGNFQPDENEIDSGQESEDDEHLSTGSNDDAIEEDAEEQCEKDKTSGANKMAAVALCVRAGSFSDPDDLPGLAHFLEHMIFMGNEKYPQENYLDSLLSKYGGSDNAYTDCEQTIFYLDVRPEYLPEVLDVFASAFTSPALKIDSMDREIEAVDSEFQSICPRDSERVDLLLRSCGVNGHPMSKFLWGNKKSLKVDPELKNINVNEELRSFWKCHYSSHSMTLAVISPEPLDVLENLVVGIFSSIPHNGLSHQSFESLEAPFKTDRFHKLYKVIPVKKMQRIVVTWALPSLTKLYRVKPLGYLGFLIGDEGRGSIISVLRKRSLAFHLEAGNDEHGSEHNSTCSLFRIKIDLTEKGMDDVLEVISLVFQYLKLIRIEGPQERIYQEIKDIEDISFRFQEEDEQSDYVIQLVENMQCYPSEHYIVGSLLYFDFDKEIIKSCTDALTFEDANIMIISSRFANENICDKREPWTQVAYCSSDFPQDWVEHLTDLDVHPDLCLPEENKYIARDFTLKPASTIAEYEYPIKILEDEGCCLWYKKDTKFNVPKGHICFLLISPMIKSSAQNAATMDLLMACLNQTFAEDLYPADAAGLSYSLRDSDHGLVLKVNGFNDKLSHLFEEMLIKIVNFSVSEPLFASMKSHLLKCYHNALINPGKLSRDVRMAILQQTYWSLVDKRTALKDITKEDLMNFSRTFLSSIFFEGLIQGNFTVEEALALSSIIREKTNAVPLSPEHFPQLKSMKIPEGESICRVSSFNTTDQNSIVVNYYQSSPGTIRTSCLMELLLSIMEEPCFDMLRTKETLGYDVSCSSRCIYGVIGFVVVVNSPSNKFSCSYIDERIEAFLQSFAIKLQEFSEEAFDMMKASLISMKECDDMNLKEEVDRNWSEIIDRCYLFDRLHKEIECLRSITLDELKFYAQKHLSSNQNAVRKLGVQVVGTASIGTNISLKNVQESDHEGNSNGNEAVYNLHFLRPSESDISFISDIAEYKSGLEMYEYCKITS